MDMWAGARRFTREDLQKAFADYEAAHGRQMAALALQRSTGAREVCAVPDGRILNGMVELIGGYSFVGCDAPARGDAVGRKLASIHASLAAIRIKAFAPRSSSQRG